MDKIWPIKSMHTHTTYGMFNNDDNDDCVNGVIYKCSIEMDWKKNTNG